jgi:diaminopimelate epimerase
MVLDKESTQVNEERSSAGASVWLPFAKYEGLGNDFILVDERHVRLSALCESHAVRLCDRHRGIGADGVILLQPATGPEADFRIRILNADGSEPEMCGNGIRCVAKYVVDQQHGITDVVNGKSGNGRVFCIETGAGLIRPQVLPDGRVCVDMGQPILEASRIPTTLPALREVDGIMAAVDAPLHIDMHQGGAGKRLAASQATMLLGNAFDWRCTAVSMGNPHCVIFVDAATFSWLDANLEWIGPLFENHSAFPRQTNTEFIEVCGPRELRMLVWERGAGRTMACGTGACASVVAAVLSGRIPRECNPIGKTLTTDNCVVHLPGGDLEISWSVTNQRVYMTGPAKFVYRGECLL